MFGPATEFLGDVAVEGVNILIVEFAGREVQAVAEFVDGKEAVSFLVRVKEGVEDPRRLLLDL